MSQSVAMPMHRELRLFAKFLPLAWILRSGERRQPAAFDDLEWGESVDPKLAMLIVLFGAIIALSHLSADRVERMRDRIGWRRWRKPAPVMDEI